MPSLHELVTATDCRLVVTQPDRPAGRGHHVRATPIKMEAQKLRIPTIEPQSLHPALLQELVTQAREQRFDLFVVASYGKIVPPWLLNAPYGALHGALNVHPSLLPLYRGAAPVRAQIRDGVTRSGVTIMMLDAGLDTGDIVVQERSDIDASENSGELHERFARLGAQALGRALEQVRTGTLTRTPQTSSLIPEERIAATLTRPLSKADRSLENRPPQDLTMHAIVNRIRSLAPQPAVRVEVRVREAPQAMKILEAHALLEGPLVDAPPGHGVIVDGEIFIRASDGWVAVDRLVAPGKRAMSMRQFRSGYA